MEKLNDELYSRIKVILGTDECLKIFNSDILIVGLTQTTIELTKNLILQGVNSVTILVDFDNHNHSKYNVKDIESTLKSTLKDDSTTTISIKSFNNNNNSSIIIINNEFLSRFHIVVIIIDEILHLHQIELESQCHWLNIPCIVSDVKGVFGWIFVDIGRGHLYQDRQSDMVGTSCPYSYSPRPSVDYLDPYFIEQITSGYPTKCELHCYQKHILEDGLRVKLHQMGGIKELNEKEFTISKVSSNFFEIDYDSTGSNYDTFRYGYFTLVPISIIQNDHKPLKSYLIDNIDVKDKITLHNGFDQSHSNNLYLSFKSLYEYQKKFNGNNPKGWSIQDYNELKEMSVPSLDDPIDYFETLYNLSMICQYTIQPIHSLLAGLISNEIVKILTKTYKPISQFQYIDESGIILNSEKKCFKVAPNGIESKYQDIVSIVGLNIYKILSIQKIWVAGIAGSMVDLLNNLISIGAGERGEIHLMDPKKLERHHQTKIPYSTNNQDIGVFKSDIVYSHLKKKNPTFNLIKSHGSVPVANECIQYYIENGLLKSDVVFSSAGHNRRYINSQHEIQNIALEYGINFFELNSSQNAGSVNTIIRHMTASESLSKLDVYERTGHASARYGFITSQVYQSLLVYQDLFKRELGLVTNYYNQVPLFENITPDPIESCFNFSECIKWGLYCFHKRYNTIVQELRTIYQNRHFICPNRLGDPVSLDVNNHLHLEWIKSAVILRANLFGIEIPGDWESNVLDYLNPLITSNNNEPFLNPPHLFFPTLPTSTTSNTIVQPNPPPPPPSLPFKLHDRIYSLNDFDSPQLRFMYAHYRIWLTLCEFTTIILDPLRFQTSFLLCQPSLIGTNCIVGSLASLEYIKHLNHQNSQYYNQIKYHTNNRYYIMGQDNVILNYNPPPPKIIFKHDDVEYNEHEIWEINYPLTLKELLDSHEMKYGIEITMVSCLTSLIYAKFIPSHPQRFNTEISNIIREHTIKPIERDILIINIFGYDMSTGEDVELPPITYKCYKDLDYTYTTSYSKIINNDSVPNDF